MDADKQSHGVKTLLPPCQLLVGPAEATTAQAVATAQKLFCPHEGCQSCSICLAIRQQHFYAVTWIKPQDRYTLEMLDPVKTTIAYALEEKQHHIFVIEHADYLTPLCANSLLKTLEEPPQGYHFILLAQSLEKVLPTIRSRSHLIVIQRPSTPVHHPLLDALIGRSALNAMHFAKLLESTKPTEQETTTLLEQLLHHLLVQHKELLASHAPITKNDAHRLAAIKKLCTHPIMPGSSKLIWRELFLVFS